jgi:hypothetical protein
MDAAAAATAKGRALALPARPGLGEASRRTPNIREFDFDGLVHEVASRFFFSPDPYRIKWSGFRKSEVATLKQHHYRRVARELGG